MEICAPPPPSSLACSSTTKVDRAFGFVLLLLR